MKEFFKNLDLKSAGVGAAGVLIAYGAVKCIKVANKAIKDALDKANKVKNEGLEELRTSEEINKEEKNV